MNDFNREWTRMNANKDKAGCPGSEAVRSIRVDSRLFAVKKAISL